MRPTSKESSSSDIVPVTECRLGCGAGYLMTVAEMKPSPLANAFLEDRQASLAQKRYPLALNLCKNCGHVQLTHEVDRRLLFDDYLYASGISESFRDHFVAYADAMIERYALKVGDHVIDIGSNDGTLLDTFYRHGMAVHGVEPAMNLVKLARVGGVPTFAEYWSPSLAGRIVKTCGPAQLVTANNVFAHVHDLVEFVEGVKVVLRQDGVFTFEVAYAADLLDGGLFDTIYHEHMDYHSVGPLFGFFRRQGLELFDVEHVPTHGGSIRCHVGWPGQHPVERSVEMAIADEAPLRFASSWSRLEEDIECRRALFERELKGKRACGYGASAKATTLLHQLVPEDWRRPLEFVVDDSPLKQGRFVPGLGIPVVGSDRMYGPHAPDVCVLLAWNLAEEITAKHSNFVTQRTGPAGTEHRSFYTP
jgi:hypothetical protein